MSEWSITPPTGATAQEFPAVPTSPERAVLDRIDRTMREMNEMRNNLLKTAGLSVVPGGLNVTGFMQSADFDTDTGWKLDGDTATFNTINLRAGIVGNAALASPVVPDAFAETGTGFAVGNTYENKAVATLTTPAGFTKAVISATASVRVLNTNGVDAVIALVAVVASTAGPEVSEPVVAGRYTNESATVAQLITGLTDGETFTVRARMYSSPSFGAHATNQAHINGTVLWFR